MSSIFSMQWKSMNSDPVELGTESTLVGESTSSDRPKQSAVGIFSMLGLFAILTYFIGQNPMNDIYLGVTAMCTGLVGRITSPEHSNIVDMVVEATTTAVAELPLSFFAGVMVTFFLGKPSGHALSIMTGDLPEDQYFKKFFLAVLEEEVLARFLFLGVLWSIFPGDFAFYVLFLIGNGLWSLVHLFNYKRKEERQVIRVLPQFIGGVFFTYVYLRYGLLGSIFAHFISNAILFSSAKRQNMSSIDLVITIYSGLCALVAYLFMSKPLSDMQIWLTSDASFTLPGWNLWDYLMASFFVIYGISFVFDVLMFDRVGVGKKDDENFSLLGLVGMYQLGVMVMILMLYIGYWLVGYVVHDTTYRVLTLAILFSFIIKTTSLSATVRVFFQSLPYCFMTICIFQAIGFWPSLVFFTISGVLSIPCYALVKLDD